MVSQLVSSEIQSLQVESSDHIVYINVCQQKPHPLTTVPVGV